MKKALNCVFKGRQLVQPNVHDARLLGWVYDNVSTLTLSIKPESGEPFTLIVNGVTRFFSTPVFGPTIIFDIEVGQSSEAPEGLLTEALNEEVAFLAADALKRSESYIAISSSNSAAFLICCSISDPLLWRVEHI